MKLRVPRLLVLVATIVLATIALIGSAARVVAWHASVNEKFVNDMLSDFGIEVEELTVRWSMLNPIVECGSLTATGVDAEGVQLEVDLLESMWTRQLSLEALSVQSLNFEVDQSSDEEKPGAKKGSFSRQDLVRLLRNIADANVQFVGRFSKSGVETTLEGKFLAQTNSNGKEVLISLRNPISCNDCGIDIRMEEMKSPTFANDVVLRLHANANRFEVEPNMLGVDWMQKSMLDGSLNVILRNGVGGGSGRMAISDTTDAANPIVAASLGVRVVKGEIQAVLRRASFESDLGEVVLPNTYFGYSWNDGEIQSWMGEIDIGSAASLIAQLALPSHFFYDWIKSLNPEGTAKNIQLVYDQSGITARMDIEGLSVMSHDALPAMEVERVGVAGHNRTFQFETRGQSIQFAHPQLSRGVVTLDAVDSNSTVVWTANSLVLQVELMRAVLADAGIAGRMGVSANTETGSVSGGIIAHVSQLDVEQVRRFIPHNVSELVDTWANQNLKQGVVSSAHVLLQSERSDSQENASVVFELHSKLDEAVVQYHHEWPLLEHSSFEIWLTQQSLSVALESSHTLGIHLHSGVIELATEQELVDVAIEADAPVSFMFNFVQGTPLRDMVGFDIDILDGTGQVDLVAHLGIPLDESSPSVDLKLSLLDLTLDLEPLNTRVSNLNGQISLQQPLKIASDNLRATILGQNVQVELYSVEGEGGEPIIHLEFDGVTTPEDVAQFVGEWLPQYASGQLEYSFAFVVPDRRGTASIDVH